MAQVALGVRTLFLPLPAVLVGADVDGKPNFSDYKWRGIVNSRPPMLSVSFRPQGYTLKVRLTIRQCLLMAFRYQ